MDEETNCGYIEVILPTKYVLTFNFFRNDKSNRKNEKVSPSNHNLWGHTCQDLLNLIFHRCVITSTNFLALAVAENTLIDGDPQSRLFNKIFLSTKQYLSRYVSKYSRQQCLRLTLEFKIYVEHLVELADKTLILFLYNQIKDNLKRLPEFETVTVENVLYLGAYVYGLETANQNITGRFSKIAQFLPAWIHNRCSSRYITQSVLNLQEGSSFSK